MSSYRPKSPVQIGDQWSPLSRAFPVTNPLTDLEPSAMSAMACLFTTVEIRGSLATSQLASIRLRTDGDDGRGAVTSTQPIPLELAGQKRSARGLESGANNGCAEPSCCGELLLKSGKKVVNVFRLYQKSAEQSAAKASGFLCTQVVVSKATAEHSRASVTPLLRSLLIQH